METFNEDYYEHGVELGISGYTNYHWKPEYSLPFAAQIKRKYLNTLYSFYADNPKVLDYGCAKGYLVKALRLLDVPAFGYDVSKYATEHADESIKTFISNDFKYYNQEFGLSIVKDTLEHVPKDKLQDVLRDLIKVTQYCIIVTVPLGDNGQYRIREYELDKTHVIKEDEEFWINEFKKAGLIIEDFYYDFPGAKDHWLKVHPFGNATFILRCV